MQFKLILALIEDELIDRVMSAARDAGATGSTVITNARGEGLVPQKTFFGLELLSQRDLILFVVEERACSAVLASITEAGELDTKPGTGIALQIPIEAYAGLNSQVEALIKLRGEQAKDGGS